MCEKNAQTNKRTNERTYYIGTNDEGAHQKEEEFLEEESSSRICYTNLYIYLN